MAYEYERQVAIEAVRQAARLCEASRQQRIQAMAKPDRSPVTIADFGAQALICRAISAAFPTDPIVGEEDAETLSQPGQTEVLQSVTQAVQAIAPAAATQDVLHWIDRGSGTVGNRYWTLDPIDGTRGFLRGDQYAVALALIEGKEPKLGVLGCPVMQVTVPEGEMTGVMFVAVRGEGTMVLPLNAEAAYPIAAAQNLTETIPRLAESVEASHGNPTLQRSIASTVGLTLPSLQMDGQTKYGAVACGQAAVYLRLRWTQNPSYQENVWDHGAGAIVVEEAGGQVSDADGRSLDFSVGAKLINNRGIVASNGELHAAVIAALRQQEL